MDPFKIKVTDEVSNTKIQEALFELGCEWFGSTNEVKPLANCWIDVGSNGRLTWSFHGSDEKELTLPQLRDLVVLKRNDVKDATHSDNYHDGSLRFYMTSERDVYVYEVNGFKRGWIKSGIYPKELKPIQKLIEKEEGLISGAEAKLAWANGEIVEYFSKSRDEWFEVKGNTFVSVFDSAEKLRIKPQTIKLDLEIPAPYKAKIGGRDDASFVLSVGRHQYCYKTEEDYTKARDALEAVFDAAVRGTNS
ncbi:hypothetical protein ACG9XQ_05675 [Acinetobacter baumannii]|uniref:hypothetical protein n=1 Tax=Acinetobacter baumannii TaxID=470 RepID=UPI003AF6D158